MSLPPPDPEFPTPLPPGRAPSPPTPVIPPMPGVGRDPVQEQLAEQRRVMVSGTLDREAVTALAAQLMAFDGASDRGVELLVSSHGGPLADFLPLLDVVPLMRAEVAITAIGSVAGTAVGLVAAGTGRRRAAPHARFTLRLDTTQSVSGTVEEVTRAAEEGARQRARYLEALADATGQDPARLGEACDQGQIATAPEALALGIIDAIAERGR